HKGWGSETNDFFCCHGTLVQANAALNRYLYYQDGRDIYVCQFFESEARFEIDGRQVKLRQRIDRQTGSFHLSSDSAGRQSIGEVTSRVVNNPEALWVVLEVETDAPASFRLHVRRPSWAGQGESRFLTADREEWETGGHFIVEYKKSVWCEPLGGDPGRVAYLYGPAVLAGLTDTEITLHPDPARPETALRRCNEREWGSWTEEFITVAEERAVYFVPLYDIGYENYAVYFRIAGR
ncbi:MAG: glycoside hydrolase family 127 protein, partial [Clostridiales bacterium]|nr:glycoside hydrolase family 127 protein [Clostridiales bacterium]